MTVFGLPVDMTIRMSDIVMAICGFILIRIGIGVRRMYRAVLEFVQKTEKSWGLIAAAENRIEEIAIRSDLHGQAIHKAGWLEVEPHPLRRRRSDTPHVESV